MPDSPRLVIKSTEEHIVLGVVYSPNSIDSDGEAMTEEAVCKMAYEFLSSGKVRNIDIMHNYQKSGCAVVESFIAREGDTSFAPGSWVLGTKIINTDIWDAVKEGKINAYSFAGPTRKETAHVLVEALDTVKGDTELSLVDIIPPHFHSYFLKFDDKGNIIEGKTDVRMGHFHKIRFPGATEEELGHAHRVNLS